MCRADVREILRLSVIVPFKSEGDVSLVASLLVEEGASFDMRD